MAPAGFQTQSKLGQTMSKRFFSTGCILAAIAVLAIALASAGPRASAESADTPTSWGFDTANLDKTCKPCDDFYQFAMGGWIKSNPIPPEYSSWGTFTQLADKNQQNLRQILEAVATAKATPGSNEQKIGDFYASCMDMKEIDAQGIKPISAELAAIEAIRDTGGLLDTGARLQTQGVGVLFTFGSDQDFKDTAWDCRSANTI